MPLFHHENRDVNDHTRRVYAAFELVHTLVEFSAAICFLIGSVMFFWGSLAYPAIWFFVIGSVLFAAKPTLWLARETRLLQLGRLEQLAQRGYAD